jgi:hypothetical protein
MVTEGIHLNMPEAGTSAATVATCKDMTDLTDQCDEDE